MDNDIKQMESKVEFESDNENNEVKKNDNEQNEGSSGNKVLNDKYTNRLINYTIIRILWRIIKGEVDSANEERNLYKFLGIGRTRYTRICEGEYASISKQLLARVKEDMNVDPEIFSGEKLLSMSYVNKGDWDKSLDTKLIKYAKLKIELHNKIKGYSIELKKEIKKVKAEKKEKARNKKEKAEEDIEKKEKTEKEQLLEEEARNEVEKETKIEKEIYNIQKEIQNLLKKNINSFDRFKDKNLKSLVKYIKDGEKYQSSSPEYVDRLIKMMDRLKFNNIEKLNDTTLRNYVAMLNDQYNMANIILQYREKRKKYN